MNGPDPQGWIARAEEDYAIARSCLRRKNPFIYGACFHAQQCVEKYLKAALTERNQAFPHTHDLLALMALCTRAGLIIQAKPDDLDALSAWAVQSRYPGPEPQLDDARSAVTTARSVRRIFRQQLGLE